MANDPRLIKLPKESLPEAWANGKPWTSKLDSELKNDWQSGMELLPILKKYGRTPIAIFSRLRQLGELSEELNPVELCKAMNSKDEKGLWDLTKEFAKGAPGFTKELTSELWDLAKVVAKEAPGQTKEFAKETIEGVKSFSKNVGESMKVEAHKHHLEHIEKMKKLEKRAKDAGISEEGLAKLKKDLGVTQEESEDTQRELEGSANLLDASRYAGFMMRESTIEEEFEKHIEHLLTIKHLKIRNELLNRFIKTAAQGHADDQYILGNRYYQGLDGVTQNDEEALKWFKKAAEQGHAEAQNKLGKMYSDVNPNEALKWFKRAAEQGNAKAMYNLGHMYSDDPFRGNTTVAINEKESFKWYKKAAEQGNTEAMYSLGHIYSDNIFRRNATVAINEKEGFKWFKKAAEQGHAEAQNTVGVHYARGDGVTQSDKEAFKWYKKSAEQGDETGRYNLSRMSDKVQEVAQDEFIATESNKRISHFKKKLSHESNKPKPEGTDLISTTHSGLTPYFSSLIEKYLSNYQAIERGEILQENLIPRKASRNNFRAVCRGEKKAVTAHEQAYMAWKKLDRPPQKGSTETTKIIDLP
jgi:TPR repeat protein/uncharacterized protein YifE (UPF0438 family)